MDRFVNGISIDTAALLTSDCRRSTIDECGVLGGLRTHRDRFAMPVVDIGPTEAFVAGADLVSTCQTLAELGYSSRLLTSGASFRNIRETAQTFDALRNVGVTRIVLRISGEFGSDPDGARTYAAACMACGFSPEIRIDYQSKISDATWDIVRSAEQASGYTTVFPMRRRPVISLDWHDPRNPVGTTSSFRIVLRERGRLLIRIQDKAIYEIHVRDLEPRPAAFTDSLQQVFETLEVSNAN